MLTIIEINANMISKSASFADPALRDRLNTILVTIKRAEDITRALLAAARRQVLEPVLVDAPSRRRETELSGRTNGFSIVNFPGPPEWVGRLIDVRITEAAPNSLRGEALPHHEQRRGSHAG